VHVQQDWGTDAAHSEHISIFQARELADLRTPASQSSNKPKQNTSRFRSSKQAISYCGLCSAEKSSADKVMRTPISKQRNKHIRQVLVEAARLAPRYSDELALLYEKERQRGNGNRATLAVARKMVALMLAVERRNTDFVPAAEFRRTAAA